MRRTRVLRIVVGLVVIAGLVVVGLNVIDEDEAPAQEPSTAATVATAEVVRTDLVETVTFDGTVGRLDDDPLAANADGTLTTIADEGSVLDHGDIAWSIDGVATPVVVSDTVLYRDLQVGDEPVRVTASGTGTLTDPAPIGSEIEQGDVLYTVGGEPAVVLYGDVPASRRLYWPEPDTDTSTSYASDVQDAQTRADLVQGIADAQAELDDARADTPSNDLLNAIDDLTRLQNEVSSDSPELNSAEQRVAAAQQADLDRIDRAEDAVVDAQQRLVDFDEVVAARQRDEAAAEASRPVEDNLVGADVRQLEAALVALGYAGDELTIDTEFTQATHDAVVAWQTDLGVEADGVVDADDVVFVPGPGVVVTMVDDRTDLSPGMQIATLSAGDVLVGVDVLLLEETIAAAGIELLASFEADDTFTAETQEAVIVWQRATGQDVDGIVQPGDLLVLREPVQLTELIAEPGDGVRSGEPVAAVASPERFVTALVPAEDQTVLAVGDQVTIELPDFTETGGMVTDVSSVATTTPDGATFFEATIALDDPAVAANLDEAPVEVIAVASVTRDALAVPVTALIALAEGGYAVEVASDGAYRLVAVDPGFFADGLVEVRSDSLAPGDLVTVP